MDVKLGNFLDKYSSLFTADRIRNWLIDYFDNNFDIKIEKNSIQIKNNKIVMNVHSAIKNEILIRSKSIIEGLKKDFGNQTPTKIS